MSDTAVAVAALRSVRASDRDAVERITRSSGLFREDEIPVAVEVFDAAAAGDPSYTALAAEADGRVVGWICWGPTPCTLGTWDLYWMAVDPSLQGTGVGTALIREMEHRLAGLARMIVGRRRAAPITPAPAPSTRPAATAPSRRFRISTPRATIRSPT